MSKSHRDFLKGAGLGKFTEEVRISVLFQIQGVTQWQTTKRQKKKLSILREP